MGRKLEYNGTGAHWDEGTADTGRCLATQPSKPLILEEFLPKFEMRAFAHCRGFSTCARHARLLFFQSTDGHHSVCYWIFKVGVGVWVFVGVGVGVWV